MKKFICYISKMLLRVAIGCSFPFLAWASGKYTSVSELVTDQKTIRVVIDEAGGYGDIAASVNVMNILRQDMNFTGTFEILYPARSLKSMITLFGLPDPLPPCYEDTAYKNRFIT